jgi:MoxR-like ATPase
MTMTSLPAIQALRNSLVSRFPERETVIDGTLCAVLASEHVLLLGPPGTAKSALTRAIAQAFSGSYFERLLTKFSTPEELFGPVSLKALERDEFCRVVTGKLPEAHFAFVDEVFKANSAILNSLLTVANERLFHNGAAPIQCPLISLFGASNELPEGKELEALWDRFLSRFEVGYLLRPSNFRAVLTAPDASGSAALGMDVLRAAQAEAATVAVTDATVDALLAIRDALKAEGIVGSDRRWKKSLRLVQASAYLAGERETSPEDLSILVDALWREPKERPKVARLVGRLADPLSTQAVEILDVAMETSVKVNGLDKTDRAAYVTQAAKALDEFRQQQTKLTDLAKGAGKRAGRTIADAAQQVQQLHSELARSLSQGLGLAGLRAVK